MGIWYGQLITLQRLIVAKVFPKDESKYTFQAELDACSALERNNYDLESEHLLNYYGSFIQNGQGVILLEYADQGSLLEFFQQGNVPYTWEEYTILWTGLANLFCGLAQIHNLNSTLNLRGVHQDLQPGNIFVFSDGSPSQYKFRFKIGDFGLSSFRLLNAAKQGLMPDNKSTAIYGAPELTTWDLSLDHLNNGVTPDVDMWSMGCILFEIIVWSICGERGRNEFLNDRLAETQHEAETCNGSFHNGNTRLLAVDKMAEKLLLRRRNFDNLTGTLCEWIFQNLLVREKEARLTTHQAVYKIKGIIKRAQETPGILPRISSTSLSSSTNTTWSQPRQEPLPSAPNPSNTGLLFLLFPRCEP
jgi:serine/threonine protein kinase